MIRRWAFIAVGFIGCESMKPAAPPPAPIVQPPRITPIRPVVRLPVKSPEVIPTAAELPAVEHAPDSLTLAAECLERGDRPGAAVHLQAYVREHPEQLMFRAQLAELFTRLGRDDAARVHFEQFALDACNATGAPRDHLVHVHTRLMEIAQRGDDRAAEVRHRGIGLLLLVAGEDGRAERDAAVCEEMLCKAIRALTEAKELAPCDPRTRSHLADAYDRAGNRRAANAERAATRTAVVPTGTTPALRDSMAD